MIVVPKDIVQNAISQVSEGPTHPSLRIKGEDIQKVCPQVSLDKVKEKNIEVIYDEAKEEYLTKIDFSAVEKYVPNSLYQLV